MVIPSRTNGDSTFRGVFALTIMPVTSDIGAITNGDTAFSFSEDARTIVSAALALSALLMCASSKSPVVRPLRGWIPVTPMK